MPDFTSNCDGTAPTLRPSGWFALTQVAAYLDLVIFGTANMLIEC